VAEVDPNSFDERAKDARNWEYHWEASAAKEDPWNPRSSMGKRSLALADERQRAEAERRARETGETQYQTDKIIANTDRFKKAATQGKKQRSSRAARGVAAQRQMATRRSGKGSGQATKLFDAPLRMRK